MTNTSLPPFLQQQWSGPQRWMSALWALVIVFPASAATVCAPGTTEPAPCVATLSQAIADAQPGEILQLPTGVYDESVDITQDLTIRSSADATVVLRGESGITPISVTSGALTLREITVAPRGARAMVVEGGTVYAEDVSFIGSGSIEVDGGVLKLTQGTLELVRGQVTNGRTVLDGGLIYQVAGILRVTDTALEDGTAGRDGGLIRGVDITLDGVTLQNGSAAQDGGAVHADNLVIRRTVVEDNQAGDTGGGLFIRTSMDAEELVVRNNRAVNGGGLGLFISPINTSESPEVFVQTSQFTANEATNLGGGVYGGDDFTIRASTFCQNVADQGGGAYLPGRAAIEHSIIAHNTARLGGGTGGSDYDLDFVHLVGNTAQERPAFDSGRVNGAIIAHNRLLPGNGASAYTASAGTALLWDNDGERLDRFTDPVVADPLLSDFINCDSPLLPGWYGGARDAHDEGTDPDGSRRDLGAYSGGILRPDLWEDSDNDGVVDFYDCEPAQPNIFPGQEDPPYDDLDQDCRGDDDQDQDGDGHRPADFGGDDCDDTSAARAPSNREIVGNGIDDDCDGWVDSAAELRRSGCNTVPDSWTIVWLLPILMVRRRFRGNE